MPCPTWMARVGRGRMVRRVGAAYIAGCRQATGVHMADHGSPVGCAALKSYGEHMVFIQKKHCGKQGQGTCVNWQK